jgi:nucleoside-diphosphate-sugar epimerase
MGDSLLITGYPSQEARAVLREALRDAAVSRAFVLAPSSRRDEVAAHLAALGPAEGARVEVVEGEARCIDMGLSGTRWRALLSDVSALHLCHPLASSNVGRERATDEILHATDEALEFAAAAQGRIRVTAYSTALVCGDREGRFFEDELDVGQHLRDGLVEAKARAEKMLRARMATTPITVVRPSIVVGDSATGELDRRVGAYGLFLLFVTAPPDLRLPSLGRPDARLNLVPVDHVARVAYAASRSPAAVGRTLHVVDPEPKTARQVFDLLAQAAGRRQVQGSVAAQVATAVVRAPGFERLGGSPRALLDALVGDVEFDDRNARSLVPEFVCPPFEAYVGRVVDFVRASLAQPIAPSVPPPPESFAQMTENDIP